MKKTLLTILTLVLTVLVGAQITNAIGSLTPSGTAGDDTQVSLNDIYGALDDFSNHTVASTTNPFAVPGSVSASFHTLSEIYALISAESSDLVPENIADGVEIFGVEGTLEAATELQWSAETIDQTWSQATLLCSTLTEGGAQAGEWRLPTIYELEAAIQEDWDDAEGDRFAYLMIYWSGTESNSNNALIAFWDEPVYDGNSFKTTEYSVRCVR